MSWRQLHHRFGRLALVWFARALGVAAASPLVQPRVMQLVCSAGGAVKLLVDSGDGLVEAGSHTLDCALCLLVGAPPADVPATALPTARPLLGNRWAQAEAPRVAGVWAPLPARGPPVRAA